MSNFRIGQKVVCVDASFTGLARKHRPALVLNQIYTIAGFEFCRVTQQQGLLLAEIEHFPHLAGGFYCFGLKRFRPVVERKTDISVFTKILDDAGKKRGLALTKG